MIGSELGELTLVIQPNCSDSFGLRKASISTRNESKIAATISTIVLTDSSAFSMCGGEEMMWTASTTKKIEGTKYRHLTSQEWLTRQKEWRNPRKIWRVSHVVDADMRNGGCTFRRVLWMPGTNCGTCKTFIVTSISPPRQEMQQVSSFERATEWFAMCVMDVYRWKA